MGGGGDSVDALVARCLDVLERGQQEELDAVLRAHPELQDELRRRIEHLRALGLVVDRTPAGRSEPLPQVPGHRVLRCLGRGGMGTVFLAEQQEPVRRIVAIKVIRAQMRSEELLRRFAAERQLLAAMAHPGIARVFDAGLCADGWPFLSMEYCPGRPITDFCDAHRLDARARLMLLIGVCEAVHHAHEKGVVHRDLKPSNILVAEQDGRPSAKVIDFGVAKAVLTGGPRSETLPGQVIGTPEYMSPEQALDDASGVDRRADVYALGVVLYELLTGTLPFAAGELRRGARELVRVFAEQSPAAPSARVATTRGDHFAEARGAGRGTLARLLRGDLDWITLRALEKEAARRYATALELADDLRRHLAHQPVGAGPPSPFYRIGKLVRRRRAMLTAAALAVALAVTASWAWWGQARAERRARRELLENATAFVSRIQRMVFDDDVVRAPGSGPVRSRLVREALEYHDSLASRVDADPELQRRTLHLNLRLGNVLATLERHDEARSAWQRCIELAATLPGLEPADRLAGGYARLERIRSLAALGALEDADAAADELDRWVASEVERGSETAELAYLRVTALGQRATIARSLGRRDDDRAFTTAAHAACEAAVARFRTWPLRHLGAVIEADLGIRAIRRGDGAAALVHLDGAVDVQREFVAERPEDDRARHQLVRFQLARGTALRGVRRHDEALRALGDGEHHARLLLERDPGRASYRSSMGALHSNAARVHLDRGAPDRALERIAQAIEHQRAALAQNPDHRQYQVFLANHLQAQVDASLALGRHRDLDAPLARIAELLGTPAACAGVALDHAARIAALARAEDVDDAERSALRRSYAAAAVAALRKASAAGFDDAGLLRDEAFATLRNDPAFAACVRAIEAAAAAK